MPGSTASSSGHPRTSAVMRHGPSGEPSLSTGNTSLPDELNEIAIGRSFRTLGLAAISARVARKASLDSSTFTSDCPGCGR